MASNEIKVTIKVDNKQFINALADCSKKLSAFANTTNNTK